MVKTCAIVGSSGSLLFEPAFGAQIQRADMVVRFNDAPTAGFEAFVGNRTDYRVYNSYAMGRVFHQCKDRNASSPETQLLPRVSNQRCRPSLVQPIPECCPNEYMILNTWSSQFASCMNKMCPRSDRAVAMGFRQSWRNLFRAIRAKGEDNWMSGSIALLAVARWCRNAKVTVYGFDFDADGEYPYHYYEGCQMHRVDANTSYKAQLESVSKAYRYRHIEFAKPVRNGTRLRAQPIFERDKCGDGSIRECGRHCHRGA